MKRALVTGGAHGIGRAIVKRFLDDGLEVYVADIAAEPLTMDEERLELFEADIGDADEVQKLATNLSVFGGVDILVNNAGIPGPTQPAISYPIAEWEEVLRVNLTGAFLCARAFAPGMKRRRWGRIVNIASVAATMPYPLRAAYAASKAGLLGLSLTLAHELGRDGITVNTVCPGPVDNKAMKDDFLNRAAVTGQTVEEVEDEYRARQAVQSPTTEDEVASMVSYLVSDAAGSITGQSIEVSSGYRS